MKLMLALSCAVALSACVATPKALPAGAYKSEAGFSVALEAPWSQWAASINPATAGEYLTKDGPLLNRLHFISLDDGDPLVKAARDTDLPRFSAGSAELEIVDFVTFSLKAAGYSDMEADAIRPQIVDGREALRFDLVGKWENGLNVKGDALAVVEDDTLNLVIFLAPELHYYEASASEVEAILSSIDFPG